MAPKSVTFRGHNHLVSVLFGYLRHSYKISFQCFCILSICRTRWVERHEAFEVFIELFEPLVCCFEDIKNSGAD